MLEYWSNGKSLISGFIYSFDVQHSNTPLLHYSQNHANRKNLEFSLSVSCPLLSGLVMNHFHVMIRILIATIER